MINIDRIYSTEEWWESKRLRYNLGLIVSGLLAFGAYAFLVETFGKNDGEMEITMFTIAFQGLGYLILIGLANVCYFLGPYCERRFRPANVDLYRKITFRLGFWFSFLLPFVIPGLLALRVMSKVTNP